MINPGKQTSIGLVFAAAMLLVAVGCKNNDIDISVSETDEELVIAASYPERDSKRVHDYIKSSLKMTDINDFSYLEIKKYETPDARMNFHIKSTDGYLKIVLDRKENTPRSYEELKRMVDGLKEQLTRK